MEWFDEPAETLAAALESICRQAETISNEVKDEMRRRRKTLPNAEKGYLTIQFKRRAKGFSASWRITRTYSGNAKGKGVFSRDIRRGRDWYSPLRKFDMAEKWEQDIAIRAEQKFALLRFDAAKIASLLGAFERAQTARYGLVQALRGLPD